VFSPFNPIDVDIHGRNSNGKFPTRQTRALPARLTAKTLKTVVSDQLTVVIAAETD
jgi:hypothetical protein